MGKVDTEEKKGDVVDGEFKDADTTSLAVVESQPMVAISKVDPDKFIESAVKQANALKKIIDAKHLSVQIGGAQSKPHVLIDGWQTLMALNGVMPRTAKLTRTFCDAKTCPFPECKGGKLTVQVVTELRRVQDSLLLTSVEAECSQHEKRWLSADHYAVTSMAQTRGIGKGCRQLYGWVMALAGFDATPAEEMPERPRETRSTPHPTQARTPAAGPTQPAAGSPALGAHGGGSGPRNETLTAEPKPIAWTEEQKNLVRARVKALQAEKHQVLYHGWKDFMVKAGGWAGLYADQKHIPDAFEILGIPIIVNTVDPLTGDKVEFSPDEVPA